jgi:O-antigen ligase
MNNTLWALYLLLASCAFALSTYVSRTVGNLVVFGAVAVFVGAVVVDSDLVSLVRARHSLRERLSALPVRAHPALLVPVVVLWVLFAIGFVRNPSFRALLRLGAFVVLSALALFVVPAVVSRRDAYRAIGVVGAACVLLGLPAALTDTPFRVAGVVLSRTSGSPLTPFGFAIHSPTAFFDTQNYFRVLVALGAVAAGGVAARTHSPWMILVCALNVLGVYLTLGRAARLATLTVAGLTGVYLIVSRVSTPAAARRVLASVTLVGIGATVAGFAVGLGLLPGVGPLSTPAIQAALGDRLIYWGAAAEAVLARPLLGWGVVDTDVAVAAYFEETYTGVHNSYLRLFLIGGLVGGVAYLAVAASALAVAFRGVAARTPLALTAFCLVVMALFFQLFAGGTIFGTSLSSVLWALTVGYAQPHKPLRQMAPRTRPE